MPGNRCQGNPLHCYWTPPSMSTGLPSCPLCLHFHKRLGASLHSVPRDTQGPGSGLQRGQFHSASASGVPMMHLLPCQASRVPADAGSKRWGPCRLRTTNERWHSGQTHIDVVGSRTAERQVSAAVREANTQCTHGSSSQTDTRKRQGAELGHPGSHTYRPRQAGGGQAISPCLSRCRPCTKTDPITDSSPGCFAVWYPQPGM